MEFPTFRHTKNPTFTKRQTFKKKMNRPISMKSQKMNASNVCISQQKTHLIDSKANI